VPGSEPKDQVVLIGFFNKNFTLCAHENANSWVNAVTVNA